MTITILAAGHTLTNTRTAVYTAPQQCVSATVLTGSVVNKNPGLPEAKVNVKIGGRDLWIVAEGSTPYSRGPWELIPVTLKPGESIDMWTDDASNGSVDVALTIGVQQ